jgi:ABC-type branched-subunit amino acid transport system ATPase component
MITKVTIENFKRFSQQEFTLSESIVLAGPNNAGKSTLLQALVTWSMTLERWRLGKGRVVADKTGNPKPRTAKMRTGQPVTRKDFTTIPLREFNLLTAVKSQSQPLGVRRELRWEFDSPGVFSDGR